MWQPRILHPLHDFLFAIRLGLPPTLRAIWASPSLLLQPQRLRNIFMSSFWVVFGPGLDEGCAPAKRKLITPYARGVVLEIGAGHGHSLHYLDREKVTMYVAVEPNTDMHPALRKSILAAGLSGEDGTAVILSYGAGDVDKIAEALGGPHQVDTIISFLTFCSVPNGQRVIPSLCQTLLRPGGMLLMYEHCLSQVWSSRLYQRIWSPIWSLVWNGCRLDRDTPRWAEQVPWSEKYVGKGEDMPDWHLFYRVAGRYVL